MRLSFSGAPEVAAALHVVWPRIVDSHFVARHGPGVESGLAEDAAPPAESSAPPTPTAPGPEGAPPNRVA